MCGFDVEYFERYSRLMNLLHGLSPPPFMILASLQNADSRRLMHDIWNDQGYKTVHTIGHPWEEQALFAH